MIEGVRERLFFSGVNAILRLGLDRDGGVVRRVCGTDFNWVCFFKLREMGELRAEDGSAGESDRSDW